MVLRPTPLLLATSLALAGAAAIALPLPATPPPLPAAPPRSRSAPTPERQGGELVITGVRQQAAWRLQGEDEATPTTLWLPLEVLQNQLGFSSRTRPDGVLDLEWYGLGLLVPPGEQRRLDDEVAIDVADLLARSGARIRVQGQRLELHWPPARLLAVRQARQAGTRRLVLDLDGPAPLRSDAGGLSLAVAADGGLRQRLRAEGLDGGWVAGRLTLTGASTASPQRIFTLGGPSRVVLDLPAGAPAAAPTAEAPDPRLQGLLARGLIWRREERRVGDQRLQLHAVGVDPTTLPLLLRPLRPWTGMEGLVGLSQLARQHDALVAINGGYFNRVRRLPLGALRQDGQWLSGPILNRGAVGWEPRQLPRFGRLRLEEWLSDGQGRRWPLVALNSGYVQRGLSRYTAAWGAVYRALSGQELAVRLRGELVIETIPAERLASGVPIAADEQLIVGRAGVIPPWPVGTRVELSSVSSDPVGEASQVVGGGPLLLQGGRVVLDGALEGFSPAFLQQGAPRTVIASDGQRLWLLTLQGAEGAGPTLAETAWLLQRLGLRDALNLDGGSSTGLVMGGRLEVRGRGVAGSVHHGLGLVPGG